MDLNRAKIVDEQWIHCLKNAVYPELTSLVLPDAAGLTKDVFLDLFHSQCVSRHLDLIARVLKEEGKTFYTIGSSGHEGNAALGYIFRMDDTAFLHYRSGAFMAQRAKKCLEINYIYDQLLSLMAAREDPISGGRHKVFGSLALHVPPQTSTIASHLPKALGAALSIILSKRLKFSEHFTNYKEDSVVLCSFGDASSNHSTAQGTFNAVAWIMRQGLKLPLVLICEDNGWGISVPTPFDWIEKAFSTKQSLHYIACDGRNLSDVYQAGLRAEAIARRKQEPVFLHMKTVRLMGHAGSDIEAHYRLQKEVENTEQDDPLLHSAHIIRLHDWLTEPELIDIYESVRETVRAHSRDALLSPKLSSLADIQSSIVPPKRRSRKIPLTEEARKSVLGKNYQWLNEERNMAQHINLALTDLMIEYPHLMLFGEDIAKKGGVYRVTQDLQTRFGQQRVFDTLLDEQTILGTALGFAQNGLIPIPEIQFLAYTHNAVDQIRGEAATLSFFSKGQYSNPMVIRIPALAYQKGFGGHFHNDNAFAFLREIPGIIVVTPSQAKDAALLLKECVRLAEEEQRVVVFLEPIALYMTKDRYQENDHLALQHYPAMDERIAYPEIGVEGNIDSDIVIMSYANGMHLSRQAAFILKAQYNVDILLLDLRWLHPLSFDKIQTWVNHKKIVLIVDESRQTGSLSEEIFTWFVENMQPLPTLSRLCAADCFIPLGDAFEKVLPSKEMIVNRILSLLQGKNYA